MPRTAVVFFRDEVGKVPVVEWLRALRRTDRKAYAKCVVRIRRLAEMDTNCGDLKPTFYATAFMSCG